MPVRMFEDRSYLQKLADVWVYPRWVQATAWHVPSVLLSTVNHAAHASCWLPIANVAIRCAIDTVNPLQVTQQGS